MPILKFLFSISILWKIIFQVGKKRNRFYVFRQQRTSFAKHQQAISGGDLSRTILSIKKMLSTQEKNNMVYLFDEIEWELAVKQPLM